MHHTGRLQLPSFALLARQALLFGASSVIAFSMPTAADAQQLRITEGARTAIEDVSTYRAHYGKLIGEEHIYTFNTTAETPANFVVLVPDTEGAKADIAISLVAASDPSKPLSAVDGALFEWTRFFDTAGRDSYLAGPSVTSTLPAGAYEVRITNPGNTGSYVLIVGQGQKFSVAETLHRYATLPSIKSDFFQKSPIEAYVTPLLLWPIFGLLIVVGLALFSVIVYRRRAIAPTV